MTKKVIDPQPIINELAQRCLKAKGLECSLLGEVIDMLKAAKPVHNVPYWATEEAFKRGYEKGYEAGKPKWIPVTERLPEVIDSYLVVVKCKYDWEKECDIDTDVAIYNPHDGGYIDNCWNTYNDWDEGQPYIHVTHWMPLPEAPKEE